MTNLGLGYAKNEKIMGFITDVDFKNGLVTLVKQDEESIVVSINELIQLKEIGNIGEQIVFDGDVFSTESEQLYEIELIEGKDIKMHVLNDELERVESGARVNKSTIASFENVLMLVGNIHEMKDELEKYNFNVVIVKDVEQNEYYYACNNLNDDEVDLIKVIFIGSTLLEEDYMRVTLSYDEYFTHIDNGVLAKVSPSELMNYANDVMYGGNRNEDVAVDEDSQDDIYFKRDDSDCNCDVVCGDCKNDTDEDKEREW